MKEIFRSVALLVPEGLRGYNGQKLILNLEPNTVCGKEEGSRVVEVSAGGKVWDKITSGREGCGFGKGGKGVD